MQETEYDCRHWGGAISLKSSNPCVHSGMYLFCISVCVCLLQEHIHLLSCRPWELRTGTAESPLKPFQGQNADPLRQLWPVSAQYRYSTVLTGWQFITQMKGSDLPRLSAELSQVKFRRFPKVGELQSQTWLGARGREEGREYAVIISLSLQDVLGMVLGASVWLLPMTVLEEA